jgi:hypothetical protein
MKESFGSLIRGGFDTWKRNLNICLPFILSPLVTLVMALLLGLPILGLAVYRSGTTPCLDPASWQKFAGAFQGLELVIILAAIVYVLVAVIAHVFFQAGAIGMAREAVTQGRTSIDIMRMAGKKH